MAEPRAAHNPALSEQIGTRLREFNGGSGFVQYQPVGPPRLAI
jgi:hypothetical protein